MWLARGLGRGEAVSHAAGQCTLQSQTVKGLGWAGSAPCWEWGPSVCFLIYSCLTVLGAGRESEKTGDMVLCSEIALFPKKSGCIRVLGQRTGHRDSRFKALVP